ncbi:MAG: lactate racemase domain-containing protein [Roseiflexus sp.]|nr:lactate racemase domain-containing protein [Roseiflexus sp.]
MNDSEGLPPSWRVTRAVSREPAAPQHAIQIIGGQRLASLARPGMRVTIAFTDATRACPDERLVGSLLNELEQCGVAPDDITLICATGLHRPSTPAERLAKLGAAIVARYRIIDHNALNPGDLVDLGTIDGIPLVINRHCLETDLLLATGVVEPHQYAGYSGGAKTVVIGCGGEATISATHGPAMLDHPGTRLGAIEGNPFQAFVRAGGERAGLRYVVNTILSETGEPLLIAAGPPALVHDYLVAQARTIYEAPVTQPVHVARAGVAGPKAVNLYQASRAATYLALAEHTPLLPGAPILLPAPIPEGAGEGAGERRFFDALSNAASPQQLLEDLRRTGFPAGAQRAYILAQVLVRHPIIVVGAQHPDIVRACHMHAVPDMAAGVALADRLARAAFNLAPDAPLEFLDVPHALLTLPRLIAAG